MSRQWRCAVTDEPPGRSVLAVLLLGSTLTVLAGAVVAPVVHHIRDGLGVSTAAAGLVLTAHALAIAVVSPAVGGIIDRHGVRRPLAAGLLLYGLGGGAALLTTDYPTLIATRIVFGLGAAVVFTGTTVALLSLYRGPQRDRVVGWRTTATSVGGVIWPLAGGAAGALYWPAPFAIYLVGVPLGIAVLLVLPDPPPVPAQARGSDVGGIGRLLRRTPDLLGYCTLFTVLGLLLYTLLVLLPVRLAELSITSPFAVAVIVAVNSVTMSATGLGYARLRVRYSSIALLRRAFAAWTVALALLGTSDQLVVIVLAAMVFGVGMGVAIPALTVLVADRAPPHLTGRVTALTATATFAGQPVAPLVVGPLVDATTISVGFLAAAALAGLLLLVLLRAKESPARAVKSSPGPDR